MNSKIFDVEAGQGDRFLLTQDELPETAIDQPTPQNIDTPPMAFAWWLITPPQKKPPKNLVLVRVNTKVGGAKF